MKTRLLALIVIMVSTLHTFGQLEFAQNIEINGENILLHYSPDKSYGYVTYTDYNDYNPKIAVYQIDASDNFTHVETIPIANTISIDDVIISNGGAFLHALTSTEIHTYEIDATGGNLIYLNTIDAQNLPDNQYYTPYQFNYSDQTDVLSVLGIDQTSSKNRFCYYTVDATGTLTYQGYEQFAQNSSTNLVKTTDDGSRIVAIDPFNNVLDIYGEVSAYDWDHLQSIAFYGNFSSMDQPVFLSADGSQLIYAAQDSNSNSQIVNSIWDETITTYIVDKQKSIGTQVFSSLVFLSDLEQLWTSNGYFLFTGTGGFTIHNSFPHFQFGPSTINYLGSYYHSTDIASNNSQYPSDHLLLTPNGNFAAVGYEIFKGGGIQIYNVSNKKTIDDSSITSCGSTQYNSIENEDYTQSITYNNKVVASIRFDSEPSNFSIPISIINDQTNGLTQTIGTSVFSTKMIEIDGNAIASQEPTVTIYLSNAEIDALIMNNPQIDTYNDIGVFKYDADCGDDLTSLTPIEMTIIAITDELNGRGYQFKTDSFSLFTLKDVSLVLPVKLIGFWGKPMRNQNKLTWSTASEQNASHFEIQYAVNGIDFETIGQVNAVGDSNQTINYMWLDNQPHAVAYYRLKMVDHDGSFEYSAVIKIENSMNHEPQILVLQNPDKTITIQFPDDLDHTPVQIFNTQGQLEEIIEENNSSVTSMPLRRGFYVITMKTEHGIVNKKIIIR